MRICLVSQEYPPETSHGGIGTQAYLKAHGLARLGHEVIVLSHSVDGLKHETFDGLVTVIRIPGFDGDFDIHTEHARWVTYSVKVASELARIHRRTPLDLLEFPEYGCEAYTYLLNRPEQGRIPSVIHLHGPLALFVNALGWPEPGSEFARLGMEMEGACLRLADAVFSSSRCSAEWCERYYGLAAENIPVLHTGVDTDLFQPLKVPKEERPTVIFAGKIARNKGVNVLVKAAGLLAREIPGLRLKIVGRGQSGLIEELNGLARAANFNGLEFAGFIPKEKLPEHLSRAHLFAGPSYYEPGPGLVYLEAMACGIPAIASSGSGGAEEIRHGENGLLVPPRDVNALAEAMRGLLTNPKELASMGVKARQYILEHAGMKECVEKIEAFYASVVKKHKGGQTQHASDPAPTQKS